MSKVLDMRYFGLNGLFICFIIFDINLNEWEKKNGRLMINL